LLLKTTEQQQGCGGVYQWKRTECGFVPLSIIISLFLLLKIVLHFANGIMPSCDDIDDDDESHSTSFEYHWISQEESLAQKIKQQKLSNNQARPDPPPTTHPASALCRADTALKLGPAPTGAMGSMAFYSLPPPLQPCWCPPAAFRPSPSREKGRTATPSCLKRQTAPA